MDAQYKAPKTIRSIGERLNPCAKTAPGKFLDIVHI